MNVVPSDIQSLQRMKPLFEYSYSFFVNRWGSSIFSPWPRHGYNRTILNEVEFDEVQSPLWMNAKIKTIPVHWINEEVSFWRPQREDVLLGNRRCLSESSISAKSSQCHSASRSSLASGCRLRPNNIIQSGHSIWQLLSLPRTFKSQSEYPKTCWRKSDALRNFPDS